MGNLRLRMIAIGVGLAVAGCAAIEREEAQSTEQLLAAAGFEMRLADSPAKMAQLSAMPQDKLIMHDVDGTPRYVYADAADCRCLYAGGQKAYDAYQKLSEQREVAEMREDAAMQWGMWGPWEMYPGW